MEKSTILQNTYKVLFYTYLTVIIGQIILTNKPNTSVNDIIIIMINIYNLLFLKIINKRMNDKNKELYEENYCKIIFTGIIIVLITTEAIKYIITNELIIQQINDSLRIELLISFIISCAAYLILTIRKKIKLNKIKKDTVTIDKDKNKTLYKNIIIESMIISIIYLIMASIITVMQFVLAFIALIIILLIGFSAG